MTVVGRIESVWRYPVKSMPGESLPEAYVSFAGVLGDRLYAVHHAGAPKAFPFLTARPRSFLPVVILIIVILFVVLVDGMRVALVVPQLAIGAAQRQRIAIARAVIRNPSVLLLDEATSALDQTTEAAINKTLLKLSKGRTMIWSTHRLTSVVEMDEIIVVSGGKAIERGSHEKLLAANGAYRRLWDDQGHIQHNAAGQTDDEDDDDDDED